ncbi:hypothetical protein L0C93_20480, partial [Salmonella enterica subsp. enterica]|nr:hypothetical protein [Salmonella enterica subsp. enterica]
MPRMTPIASLVLLTLFTWQTQAIATETFDTHFMVGGMRDQKITNFHLDENKPIPGQYELDIYVNNQWRGKYDIIVADDPGSTCISTELLKNIGVISDGLQPQGATDCIALKDVVRSGGYTFNIGVFRLDLSVPQAYVNEVEAGYVLMNPLMILVKIIKLRWIHILSYDQMVSRKINNQTTRCANSIF